MFELYWVSRILGSPIGRVLLLWGGRARRIEVDLADFFEAGCFAKDGSSTWDFLGMIIPFFGLDALIFDVDEMFKFENNVEMQAERQ